MKVTLINPNIRTQKGDFFGSGIPFLPITLAYLTAYLRKHNHIPQVIDAFGEKPTTIVEEGDFLVQGLSMQEIMDSIDPDCDAIILYASLVITHNSNICIIKEIRKKFDVPIFLIENIHSVVGYSLLKVHDEYLAAGVNYVLLGDSEEKCVELLQNIKEGIQPTMEGIIFMSNGKKIIRKNKVSKTNLDTFPFPAWDLFPIKNYWALQYAHAPMKESYLPLLTSRGCPYPCEFCVTPLILGKLWRPRSPHNVVDEIEHSIKEYGVTEFHIEDLNPTVGKYRFIDICKEIVKRDLKIELKIVAGTKAETFDKETIGWMKKAGFSYVSISPESGSKKVLSKMKKGFSHRHGIDVISRLRKAGITSQACFVLGFPGEKKKDLQMTRSYIKQLVQAGIDEVAIFIMTPIPGSAAFDYAPDGYENLNQLTFSPKWRPEYKELRNYRNHTYVLFFLWKLLYQPWALSKMVGRVFTKNFNTKMEMAFWRVSKQHIKSLFGEKL